MAFSLGGLVRGIGGALVGGATSLITSGGNPIQALKGAATGAYSAYTGQAGRTPSIAPPMISTGRPMITPPISSFASMGGRGGLPALPGAFDTNKGAGGLPSVPTPGFYHGTLSRLLPGGESGYSAAPPGYHLNKRYLAYYRGTQLGKQLVDPTSRPQVVNPVVKNRKMNPLNPRALKRANARQVAAVRLMRATLRGTGYRITRAGFGRKKGRK